MEQKIKTFEDACKILDIPANLPDVSHFPAEDKKSQLALYKLSKIAKAINEGWVPDWRDYDQRKWYPWFEASPSGSGFSSSNYGGWCTGTYCGSRLCFKSDDIAEYVGKQFIDLYNDLFSL